VLLFSSQISSFRRPRTATLLGALVVFGALVAARQAPPASAGGLRSNAPGQPQPTGTAVISGSVNNSEGGRPIRRAAVRLASVTPGISRGVMTDDMGNFQFKDLPAGQFVLSASKAGYLDGTYGQKTPGNGRPGTPLSVVDGQHLDRIRLPMPRGGVISGTIVDEVGEPAYLTVVRALQYGGRLGERTLAVAGSAVADDRGVYRIPVLTAGDYIIMATPLSELPLDSLRLAGESFASGRGAGGAFAVPFLNGSPDQAVIRAPGNRDAAAPATGYAPVYFSSTTIASAATTVTLGVSEERSGIDIQLQRIPLGRITGTIGGADQSVLGSTTLTLIDPQGVPGMNLNGTRPGPDGTFSFTGVVPGEYTLSARSAAAVTVRTNQSNGQTQTMLVFGRGARPGGSGGPGGPIGGSTPVMWASADLVVDGRQPATVALTLEPSMTVSGRVAFDGTGAPPTDLTQIGILLTSAGVNESMSSAMGQVDADGRFRIAGVTPGRYVISPRGISTWRARSADVGGRDALDFLLDVKPGEDVTNVVVTLTDRASDLSGTLDDALGRATSDATVIVFADDPQYWTPRSRRIMATRPSTDGKFSFPNLPAGDYRLIAVSDVAQDQWFDPAFLRQLSSAAVSLKLADGERKTQNLRKSIVPSFRRPAVRERRRPGSR
jgi:hypothetical protein